MMSDVAEIQFDFRLDKLSGSKLTFQLPQNPIIKPIKGGGDSVLLRFKLPGRIQGADSLLNLASLPKIFHKM